MKRFFVIIIVFLTLKAEGMNYKYDHFQDSVPFKQMSFIEGEALLKEKHGILNETFSKPNLSKVYNLNDGTVLVIGKKACFLYESESDIKKLLKIGPKKISILFHINHYGEKLPLMTDDAVIKLSNMLQIPLEGLDFTEASLNSIDEALIKKQIDSRDGEIDLKDDVIYFITYANEVFIRKYGGSWQMILDDDQETWLPYISLHNQRIDLFTWIYDSICNLEEGELATITGGYQARVANFLRRK